MDIAVNPLITIFRKTAKGHAEIETRANRLPLKQRSVLIMIDGRTPDRDLRRLAGAHVDSMIGELLAGDYIEAVGTVAPRPAPAPAAAAASAQAPAPAAAPAAQRPGTPLPPAGYSPSPHELQQLRRDAVRQLIDLIGPMGEPLAMRIEATRGWAELKPLLGVAQQTIANVRGRAAAEAWAARFSGS
ncbi:MAG: hypothetical protein JNJ71_02545 [Rubrivivax sp.]|nr:hypothetical protein [Rubrivivax sp.]